MRPALPVLLALVLAGCTSGTAGTVALPSAAPSARSSPPAATATADRSLVVAVRRDKHPGLWVYRVDAGRRAVLLRVLEAPAVGGSPTYLSLSEGSAPTLCTVWASEDREPDPVWCYDLRDGHGRPLPVEGDAYGVSLRHDGEAVAWESVVNRRDVDTTRDELVVASFGPEGARDERRFVSQSSGLPPGTQPLGCSDTAGGLTWAGDEALLVQAWGEDDFPGKLFVHSADHGVAGTTPACRDVPEPEHRGDGYSFFKQAAWSDGRTFLALEGVYCELECGHTPRSSRAVRVDVRTGRVVEVVATAAAGRDLTSVSGGDHGIAYVTWGRGDQRVYVRWPGEEHGRPVTGLPGGLDRVVAQP